ncbi:hypothetical protein AFK24_27960 [Pseudomonas syringae]|uniref:Uncharacterized protein n=1 Tax=Pseudomonas syringae TaxID=317 RepID=A0A1C7YYF9_PSESX|nr:hypothetical protein [Pseudomonas syringae]OCR21807.1 hypothetical protein AFK24_27960 [Pseudomonas syringae]
MCNSHRRSVTRSARKADPVLAQPIVPVADEVDGLIKTADLDRDVVVNFPVWDGADFMDRYVLARDGAEIGTPKNLDPVPPVGTILTLEIPVATELTEDGLHSYTYLVSSFPGGNGSHSPEVTVLIDRTPPGAHQLGHMDFPDEAKDGLTAAELNDMGNVLTGQILGYTGLSRGDVIKTYWGDVAGPEVELQGDEDGSQPIEVLFDKAFLTSLGNSAGATFYRVMDRAGNLSGESRKLTIPLFLTEITPDLPPPVIDAFDGTIDYNEAKAGVEVKIPTSDVLEEGDEIVLNWGSQAIGPYPIAPGDIGEPFVLIFDVAYETIELAGDGLRQLKYDVVRNSQIVGFSEQLEVNVNVELPVPGNLDKPTIRGASSIPSNEDNFIDVEDFELNATIIINWNSGFKAAQIINIYWGGQEVLAAPYVITNTDVAAGRSLLLTALNSKFKPVGAGNDIRVFYTVASTGNPNASTSPEQSIIVQSKDELPGGPDGPDAPEFTALNENGAINVELSVNGAPVFIKPYTNIASGQTIVFTYEAYNKLVGGEQKFIWTHTSLPLSEEEATAGYNFAVPLAQLTNHCYGHAEAFFQVQSDKGQGNSKRASVFVDLRVAGVCS